MSQLIHDRQGSGNRRPDLRRISWVELAIFLGFVPLLLILWVQLPDVAFLHQVLVLLSVLWSVGRYASPRMATILWRISLPFCRCRHGHWHLLDRHSRFRIDPGPTPRRRSVWTGV